MHIWPGWNLPAAPRRHIWAVSSNALDRSPSEPPTHRDTAEGHTHGFASRCGPFDPPLRRPEIFAAADSARWREHVAEEGYGAVADIIPPEDVDEAARLLLRDLQRLRPELRSLAEVREHHLPRNAAANDLRTGGGLWGTGWGASFGTCPKSFRRRRMSWGARTNQFNSKRT